MWFLPLQCAVAVVTMPFPLTCISLTGPIPFVALFVCLEELCLFGIAELGFVLVSVRRSEGLSVALKHVLGSFHLVAGGLG